MRIDNELLFADGTWAPTTVATNVSPNVWDSGPYSGKPNANTGRDIGQGEPLWFVITVLQTCTSGGGATVDFRLRSDSNSNLTTSPVDHVSTGATGFASLTAGTQYAFRVPSGTYKRYIGAVAVIATAALTAGMFHIFLGTDLQRNTKYAGGFVV